MTTTIAIPEPFVWNQTFEVGYPNLDEQHKMMFSSILDLCNHPADKMRLDCMISVIQASCLTEEVMMKQTNNPDFETHKMAHDDFISKMKSLTCPLTSDEVYFCKEWLVNHLMTMDLKNKDKLYTYPNL